MEEVAVSNKDFRTPGRHESALSPSDLGQLMAGGGGLLKDGRALGVNRTSWRHQGRLVWPAQGSPQTAPGRFLPPHRSAELANLHMT